MAKIHDKFVIELAEVIKGYGNDPSTEDPFHLPSFFRFYEIPNIAISEDDFKRMKPLGEPERKNGECQTCKRNANNGGVYEDGRTKCPIQEHYALLKDGYCHLYEPYSADMRGEQK